MPTRDSCPGRSAVLLLTRLRWRASGGLQPQRTVSCDTWLGGQHFIFELPPYSHHDVSQLTVHSGVDLVEFQQPVAVAVDLEQCAPLPGGNAWFSSAGFWFPKPAVGFQLNQYWFSCRTFLKTVFAEVHPLFSVWGGVRGLFLDGPLELIPLSAYPLIKLKFPA